MTEPIARIEAALTRLGAEHEPPPGWEARVLAATARRTRRPWWLSVIPAIPVAALAVVGVVFLRSPDEPEVALTFSHDGSAVFRGPAEARVDDTMHATAHGADHVALWIYRDDKLVKSCPGDPRCQTTGRALSLDVVLDTRGRWVGVAVSSSEPIAGPSGSYDTDIAGLPVGAYSEKTVNVK
jgi:hypothetical protein